MAARTSPATMTEAPTPIGRWRAALLVATWLWVALSAGAADVTAAEPANVLDRPIVDVAVIDRGADRWPDLLTLDQPEGTFGTIRLGLLRRDVAWSSVATETVTPTSTLEGGGIGWLVDLGGGRFAVVVASWGPPRTLVLPVEIPSTAGADTIVLGAPVALEVRATDAGAADVDGDGTTELVVAGNRNGDAFERCAETTFEIMAGDDLAQTLRYEFIDRRIGGAVLGEWDGRPGIDLLANLYDTCPADPEAAEVHHLHGIRLGDGSTIIDVATRDASLAQGLPAPLAIDVDGDGRDEAIVTDLAGLAILDPTNEWRSLAVAEGSVTPLAALRAPIGPPAGLLTWVATADSPIGSALWTRRIAREDGVLRVSGTTGQPLPDLAPDELESARDRSASALQEQQPPLVWTADLDRNGCLEVHAPSLDVECLGAGPVRRGSTWQNTRPLGVIGPSEDRRLLLAHGLEWYPSRWGPLPPNPTVAGAPGAWRHPFAIPFTLAEVQAPVRGPAPSIPVPDPVVDTTVDADGRMSLHAPVGTRLLLRAKPIMVWDESIGSEPDRTRPEFLYQEPREQEFVGLFRALDETGLVPFDIRAMSTDFSGVPAERWLVTLMAVDVQGEVSDPVSAVAVYDVTAPSISMEAPFLTAPWPFDAALAGTSEAGATVRVGDGPQVTADGSGAFTVRTPLAPWPQTVELTAVDRHGNATPLRVSVMGGVDVRQLPWPAIAAASVLLAVFLSAIRGSRGARPIAIDTDADDLGDGPMIEELGGGPVRRRDRWSRDHQPRG